MTSENDLSNLTWTTRREVAAQLAQFLAASRPVAAPALDPETSFRARATELLSLLKVPAQENYLRTLALDAQEELEVRWEALHGLALLSAGVTGPELNRLLADKRLPEDEDRFGPHDLVVLARQQDAQDVVLRYLRALLPENRSWILQHAYVFTPAPLLEWMYAQWLNEDRHRLAADQGEWSSNEWVIRMTGERIESRAIVLEMWRAASGTERSRLLELFLGLFADDVEPDWSDLGDFSAEETSELTELLALPVDSLLAAWGPERFFAVLDAQLLAEHERSVTSHRLRKVIEDETGGFLRALRVLRNWRNPAVDDWLVERAVGSELHEDVRSWLMMELWARNRAQFSKALAKALESGDHDLARQFLLWTRSDPQDADRSAFEAALQAGCSSKLQYYALRGLEALGETGEGWETRLFDWSRHPEPRLRIRARAALARRGDLTSREVLRAWAEGPHPLFERAEVIAALGELDDAAFLPLFARVLALQEQPEERSSCAPAAEEAALALARVGTPEALTALIQSYLSAKAPYLRGALHEYLTAIVDAEPDPSPVRALPQFNWYTLNPTRWKESARSAQAPG